MKYSIKRYDKEILIDKVSHKVLNIVGQGKVRSFLIWLGSVTVNSVLGVSYNGCKNV